MKNLNIKIENKPTSKSFDSSSCSKSEYECCPDGINPAQVWNFSLISNLNKF